MRSLRLLVCLRNVGVAVWSFLGVNIFFYLSYRYELSPEVDRLN